MSKFGKAGIEQIGKQENLLYSIREGVQTIVNKPIKENIIYYVLTLLWATGWQES